MKKYLILTFLGALSILMGKAQEQTPQTYQLTVGEMCMTIDAQKGARIMSLKYGDKEVISQTTWPETFGSTFWTSPQKEWNWPPVPEYDKLPYAVEERDGRIVMTSGVSERMKYRIEKTFATDQRKQAFVVTYSIINESTEPRKVAPWEITRVPNNGGLIFFDAPVESITPAGLMDFRCVEGVAWYQPDVTQQNRKINADGKGWLAYANDGLLLVKQFTDLDASQVAPDEAEVQVYVNRGKTYIELESQGAYTSLQPGERLDWTVTWRLLPYEGETVPSKGLLSLLKTLGDKR